LKTLWALYALLKEEKPDKIFSYQAKTVIYGGIAARLNGIRDIYPMIAGVGSVFLGEGLKKRLLRSILVMEYKLGLKNVSRVFFQNRDDLGVFTSYGIVWEEKVVMLNGSGVNIHRTPYAGRVFEYYSEDGILTGLIDTYETQGIQSKGVYVYNKHFALNDQELQRQGLGTWCNEQAMREIYLRAFELPIVYADAKCVMTAFNRIGAVWAGSSYELITSWLRGEAGMSGHAVTDMYEGDYMSKPHEVLAGNDIPDNFPGTTGTNISGASTSNLGFEFAAYGPNGETPNAQIAQALRTSSHRVLYTVLHSRGMDGISSNSSVVQVTTWWQMILIVTQWTTLALTVLFAGLLILDICKEKGLCKRCKKAK
jgi:hypothetical protein